MTETIKKEDLIKIVKETIEQIEGKDTQDSDTISEKNGILIVNSGQFLCSEVKKGENKSDAETDLSKVPNHVKDAGETYKKLWCEVRIEYVPEDIETSPMPMEVPIGIRKYKLKKGDHVLVQLSAPPEELKIQGENLYLIEGHNIYIVI